VVSAHPDDNHDDNEFIFRGTIAAINALPSSQRAESVGYAIFTNSNKGCFNTTLCKDTTVS
jgi:LmbE family N-acetylglucosaminyl deacetylase